MANDILGITGSINLNDIQKTFDALISQLERVGVSTESMSERMTKALTDIANSADKDLATKAKMAMTALKETIKDANDSLGDTPGMISKAKGEVSRLESACSKLEKEIEKATKAGKNIDSLNTQLANNREALQLAREDVQDLEQSYLSIQSTVGKMEGMYNGFVAVIQEQANAAQESAQAIEENTEAIHENADAAADETGSIRQESDARRSNAEAVSDETEAIEEQGDAKEGLNDTTDDFLSKIIEEANSVKELRELYKQYEKDIKDITAALEKLNYEEAKSAKEKRKQQLQERKAQLEEGGASTGGYTYNDALYRKTLEDLEKIQKELDAIDKQYNTLNNDLKEYESQAARVKDAIENWGKATKEKSPVAELRNLRNEITRLLMEYNNLSLAEKNGAKGQELKTKIEELTHKAAELEKQYKLTSATIKQEASNVSSFQGMTQAINLLVSGLATAQGAAAAFGVSEEDLVKVQTTLQASLAATNFLTEAGTALQSKSALMHGIASVQAWAAAKATDMDTAAKGRNIVVTTAATVAQKIFNAVAKANPYVLLATAILSVVGALAAFAFGSKEATEAEKEHQKAMEEAKAAADRYKNTLSNTYADLMSKYAALRREYNSMKSDHEKTKWIENNRKRFEELGISVTNIKTAEDVFRSNTNQVVDGFKRRAEAAALAAQMVELYRQKMDIEQEAATAFGNKKVSVGDKYNGSFTTDRGSYNGNYQTANGGRYYSNDRGVTWYYAAKGVEEYNNQLFKTDPILSKLNDRYEEVNSKIDESDKKLQQLGDTTNNVATTSKKVPDNTLNNLKKREQEYLDLIEKQRIERERAAKDLEFSTAQATIDAMEDGNQKTIAQLTLDFKKQEEEIKRGYEDLKRQKIEAARQLWEANPANSGKIFDANSVNTAYTAAEAENYRKLLEANEAAYKRSLEEMKRAEREAINEYLQEYGTWEQKRLAITEEYEEKIKHALNAGQRLSLQRQMEKELAELDMSKFEKSINWEVLFNDLDKISVEHLNRLKEQLKEALRTDNITAEQAKVISERINAINSQLQTKAKEWQSAFGLVIPELEEMRRLEQEAIEAQDRKEEAQERLNRSLEEELRIRQEIIDLLEQNGITANASEVTATNQDNFLQMMQGMGKDTKQLSDLFSKLGKSEAQVAQNTEALAGAEAEAGASAEAAGGSFAMTVAIIDKIVHTINDNVQSLNELLAQMDLADTKFGKGFSKFAESSEYATKAWESLKSGNIMGVANGVYGSLRTLGEALGEWGVAGMGSSDTSLHDDMILLTQSNKDLKMAIDELAKVMEDSAVAEATEIFSQQKSRIEDSIKNTLELMQRAASAYSNGFLGIGGHHSSGSKINDAISSTEWDRISKLLGKSVRSAGDFFSLTSEEMYRVATELTDIYSRIKDLADDGYENAAQFMDEYISYWQQLEELQNAYYEKMTSVSFDTIESDFKSVLMDMDSDVEAFSENFEKYLQQAIINSLVSEKYRPLLEKWYHMFSSYMEDGRLDDWERYNLLNGGSFRNTATGQWESAQGWNSITQQGIDDRNAMRDLFGWGTEDEEEAKEYFSNIRDMWVSTLTDMEADAESWQKEITRIMVEDLVNSLVLGDDFEKWLADWKERYADELAHGMDADRLNALIAEMVEKRKELAEQSQGIMDSLGYTDLMKEIEESEDVFEDLHDNFLDALMDMDTDAEQWGKKIAETLARQIIEQELLNQAFDGMLDEWKQGVADYMNLLGMGSREDEEALNGLKAKIAEIVEKYKELAPMAQEFLEALGLIEEAKPETPFNNLRQSFLSTLLDMKSDAESFRRDLDRTLVQDMIEKFIFDVKMTINGQDFDNFDAYLEDWNRRYLEIFQNGDLTKEQKESQLQALIDELMQEREMLDKASEDLRERLKEIEESVPDSTFKEMTDDWISTLMDFEATAEDWAENVGRMMARKIIEQMIAANMIQPLLDQLQDAFNSAMEVEGATWQSVIQGLAPQIETLKGAFNELQPIVQQILNAFGIFKEEVEEVEEIGDTTFKDLTDSWISTLMDMNATAEDWAESVGRTMAKRIIEEMVAAKFLQPLLDSLQTVFDDAIARGLSMTQVLALLTPELDKMKDTFNEVRPIVEEILNAFGLIKEEVEEIEEEADTTFKDMAGEWASALMDMDMTAEQWAQNVGRKMAQRIIEELVVARLMQPLLDSLQMAFDTALNAVDATWESAIAALSPYIGQLTEAFAELQPIAEQILNSFGIFREEVAEEAKEGFSDLRGAFVSSLMDMEADADKFAKDIARIMTEQMVDRLIEKQFGSQIDALNEEWYNALEAGDTAAMERIRQQLIELQQLCGEAVQPLLDTLEQIEYVPEVVEEEVDETITSMRDDFLNALMDMRAGTQDFANDIRKILTKKMIEKFVLNSQFDAWLESIQSKYDAIFNSSASEEEMADAFERLATEWELKANEMQQMTQRIFDLTGWSDIVERMNSPLTDLRSNFLSALMDMEADAKDFTKEISELLTEAFIDKFVLGDEFEKRLAEWQEQYAAIMKGNYSEEERADLLLQLQNAISAAKEGYAKEAQVIQELMGTYSSPDQQATMNMADKVTYDQFETYLGIAVAQQMATLAGNEIRIQILATLQAMSGITSPNGDTVREIRSTLNTTNEYLLDIKRSNKDILNQFGEKLDNIINKLSDLV